MHSHSFTPLSEPALPSRPDHVQIQTVTGCNADCIFCPNRKTERHIPLGRRMEWDLYRSVVDQCLELGIRRYTLYLMNEPMLDRELPQRIAYISSRIRRPQYTKTTSHGGLLTERMAQGLLDSGLDKLKISVQSLNPERYWKIMRLRLDKTLRNIDRFLDLKARGGYRRPKLEIVVVDSVHNHDEIPEIRNYWQKREIRLVVEPVENRADHGTIRKAAVGFSKLQPFTWCRRLKEQLYVLYDGRVLMCCADWEQRAVLGDLKNTPLRDIWYGERYAELRRRFVAGDLRGTLCESCRKQLRHSKSEPFLFT
jgi:MoaA/NifB/PqqE/SkfB family radical SAM enzyme